MKSVQIMGVKVDAVTLKEASGAAEAMLSGNGGYIVTPNPEIILAAQKDAEFKQILNNSTLALPDGAGIIWAAKKLGIPFIGRITGTDFLLNLAEIAQKNRKKLALIGGRPGIAEASAQKLGGSYAGLEVRGFDCGEIDEKKIPEKFLNEIKDFAPAIMAVALGAPKQEKFIMRILPLFPSIKIAIGVGGALDYVSGRKTRAPKWMRDCSIEWLWRLIQEPQRLPRIINAAVLFPIKFLLDKAKPKKI